MKLRFTDEVYDKLWCYTHSVDTEIAAWGYVKPVEGGDLLVDDVFLVPQEVSAVSVDFVSEGMPYAVKKSIEDGRVTDLRFCWHSHVNMPTGYSSTDEEMIGKIRDGSNVPWFASTIFNKKGETNGRLDIFDSGVHDDLTGIGHIKGIKLDVITDRTELLDAEVLCDIERLVKRKQYQSAASKHKSNAGSNAIVPAHQYAGMSQSQQEWWKFYEDDYEWGWEDDDGPSMHDAIREGGKLDGTDLTAMSDNELRREVKIREAVLTAAQTGWHFSRSDDGWIFVSDEQSRYKGQIICPEFDEYIRESLNMEVAQ